jgi:hypothetical protein
MRSQARLMVVPVVLALAGCAGALPDCNDGGVREQRQQHLRALLLEGDPDQTFLVAPTAEVVSSLDRRDRVRYCRAEMTYGVASEAGTSVQTVTVRMDFQLRTNDLDGGQSVVMQVQDIDALRKLQATARQLKQAGGQPPAAAPAAESDPAVPQATTL